MPPIPSTLIGVVTLVVLVLPGVIYSAVRMRYHGFRVADREVSSQIVRAFAFSFIADALYLAVLGDLLLGWMKLGPSGLPIRPRELGLSLLVLGILIPALVATLQYGDIRIRQHTVRGKNFRFPRPASSYDPTPTAWDMAALALGERWIRIRMSDDRWIGGWYSSESYVSTYPEPPDIYIESQHQMTEAGEIGEEVKGTAGVWVPLKDATLVEWINPEPNGTETTNEQGS
ncbi:DUF6338 family protein [Nocardia fluminea]